MTTVTAHEDMPHQVRAELERAPTSVLVDTDAVHAVRERFDTHQATSLHTYLQASQSPNTLRAYRSDWVAFAAWCGHEHRTALPADPLDVATYLAVAADTTQPGEHDPPRPAFSPATLERKAAAIAAVHAAHGLPSPTRSDLVRLTLRGIRRRRRARPRRKRPILLHTLDELLTQLPTRDWPHLVSAHRDRLLLLVGFAGALRRGELAALTLADVTAGGDPTTGEPLLLVELAATKTDPAATQQHRVALPRGQQAATCPVCAFHDWTELLAQHRAGGRAELRRFTDQQPALTGLHRCHATPTAALPDNTALFPPVNRHGGIGTTPITGRTVANLVKRHAHRAGLDPELFSGHSLRAGFATQAALGGASDREIMRQGRWSNPGMVHRYIRTARPLDDNAVTKLGL